MTKITYIPGEIANAAIDEHGKRKPVTRTQHIFDDNLEKPQNEVNQDRIEDVATLDGKIALEKQRAEGVESSLNNRLGTVEQLAEISIGGGDAQIATGADFTNPDATKRAKVPTVGAIVDGLNDGVYDVSKRNPSGGPNSDGKFTLEYILSNADTLIPTGFRHGGMIMSFAHINDNNYVKFFCTAQNFTTDISQWQGVDSTPTNNSNNLVTSGGVQQEIMGNLKKDKVDIGGYQIYNGYINESGNFGTSSSYRHGCLAVNEGDIFVLKNTKSTGNNIRYAFATSSNSSTDPSSPDNVIPIVSGTEVESVEHGDEVKIVIPEGCSYLLFNENAPNSDIYQYELYRIDKAEEIERKLPRLSIVGKVFDSGTAPESFGKICGSFLAGHKYRVWIINPNNIIHSSEFGSVFTVFAYNNAGGERNTQDKVRVNCLDHTIRGFEEVLPYYDFELPTSATVTYQGVEVTVTGVKEWWLQLYARAFKGVAVDVRIEDITLIPKIEDNLYSDSTGSALSANQGKKLKYSIDNIVGGYFKDSVINNSDIQKTNVHGCFGRNSWVNSDNAESAVIDLQQYKQEVYNSLYVTAKDDDNSYVTITKKLLPDETVDYDTLNSEYLSSVMGGNIRNKYSSNTGEHSIDISGSDSLFAYVTIRFASSDATVNIYPKNLQIVKDIELPSIIDERINEHDSISLSGASYKNSLPALLQGYIDENGHIVADEKYVTTGLICGGFYLWTHDDYRIYRVVLCNLQGNVVDYYKVQPDTRGNAESTGVYGSLNGWKWRKFYGTCNYNPKYAFRVILCKKSLNESSTSVEDAIPTQAISTTDNIIKQFGYVNDSRLTLDVPEAKEAYWACVKRALKVQLLVWETAVHRDASVTSEEMNAGHHNIGQIYIGAPYSSVQSTNKFLFEEVTLDTFMSALRNKHSLWSTEYVMQGNKAHSDYGIIYTPFTNSTTYYGMVCSQFVSYVIGLHYRVDTGSWNSIPNMSKQGEWHPEAASPTTIDLSYITNIKPLDMFTNSHHTFMCIGTMSDVKGKVKLILIAESVRPTATITPYTPDALLNRLNSEWHKHWRWTDAKLNGNKDYDVDDSEYVMTEFDQYIPDIKYNDEIQTFAGNKAAFIEGNKIWLNAVPSDKGYTKIELFKDNNVTATDIDITGYTPDSDGYIDVNLTTMNLSYGKYKARLSNANGSVTSDYTLFEVINVTLSGAIDGNNVNLTFSSANGTPVYIRPGNIHAVIGGYVPPLNSTEISTGTAVRDLASFITASSENQILLFVDGDYGRVAKRIKYVNNEFVDAYTY